MRNGYSGAWWAAGLALAVLLAWGLEQVAVAPLETGAVYPAYSTLRSDPVGAKALYESLAELPAIQTERLYKSRSVLDAKTVLLVLGIEPKGWSTIEQKTLTEYEDLVAKGGRLVIGFLPTSAPSGKLLTRVLEDRWHVTLTYDASAVTGRPRESMPRQTALYFTAGPEWRTISAPAGEATAIERDFGSGTVVLLADSFPLSNEGLRDARDAHLVATLVRPAVHILFDESHFGVQETGGVVQLVEKYHLLGAVLVLALVAALFIWRSATSFLPSRAPATDSAIAGRDSLAGMSSLLRRSVAESDLMNTCYAEWARTPGMNLAGREQKAKDLESEIMRAGNRDLVERYRAACKVLARRG